MKVGLLADAPSLQRGSGIARYDLELFRGLKARGLDVQVLSIRPIPVPFGQALTHAIRLPACALKRANDFDLLHATAPITGLCLPLIKKPTVITFHDLLSMLMKDSDNSFHARLFAPFFFKIGTWNDRLIADSSQTKAELITQLDVPAEKIQVVNLGIGHEFRPLEKQDRETFTIGYVGALARRKRLHTLINVFNQLRKGHRDVDARLIIYGTKAHEYKKLAAHVKQLDLEREVEFRGFVPEEKLAEAYNSLDVFAMMSEWEGFGLPILEAQKCGVPVVIREDARIPEEVTRCTLQASSERDFSEKIYELLTNSLLKKRLSEAGLKYADQFTWEKAIDNTVRVYEEALTQ